MRALDRKLLRDLKATWGQALAIALVIGSGVAMFVMSLSTLDSLQLTRSAYYERYRFGQIFASLKRAPLEVADRVAELPGVAQVEARVVASVNLDIPGMEEPASGRLLSIPATRQAILNDFVLRRGRYLDAGRPDEVLVSENFAKAHDLEPGDRVAAVINGRRRALKIVGLALSPEFIYSIQPGDLLPDDRRFGIFWMERKALATAFDMEGGFNDVVLTLSPGASEDAVLDGLDRLLERYGGLGAIPRSLQVSNWYLENEFRQLETLGVVVPVIFLGVAAFLLNVVLARLLAVQRGQIAALKALGYSNGRIGWHYVQWGLLISLAGAGLGLAAGAWLGQGMTRMYTRFFHFPFLEYRLAGALILGAVAVSLLAAALGAVSSVRRAVAVPPAEAMRPEPPAVFRRTWVERLGLGRLLNEPARMVIRNLWRRPVRSALSVLGIALAAAMPIVGTFAIDAVNSMIEFQFSVAQRQDMTVTFVEPRSAAALYEVSRLPGTLRAEPFRIVPVRLRAGHRYRQTAITGLPPGADLNRVVDASGRVMDPPSGGLMLSAKLAELLHVEVGDELTVEVLEGRRAVLRAPITRTLDDYLGTNVYMDRAALHRLLREGESLSGAYLAVDSRAAGEIYRRLKMLPAVAGASLTTAALESLEATFAENIRMITFFNMLFSAVIAFGVVYNNARISLSERGRELASLRVLGFTRREISLILLGELAAVTLVALPVGLAVGHGLAALTTLSMQTELFRLPFEVSTQTYLFAAGTVVVASLLSGLAVRRRLDRLDLIAVLKTRE